MPKPKLTEEAATYEWLRGDHTGDDRPPPDFMWRLLQLVKNLDERVTALEKRQDPNEHNSN